MPRYSNLKLKPNLQADVVMFKGKENVLTQEQKALNNLNALLEQNIINPELNTFLIKEVNSKNKNVIKYLNEIKASNGVEVNLNDSISTTVKINEYGKGGDVEQTQNPVTTTPTPTVAEPTVQPVNLVTTPSSTVTVRTIKLSSDNLIKSLKIKGYSIDFNPNKLEYSIKVKNNVKSLDLEIILNDENASYEVSGNQNFKVGENSVTIKVTAEDGSERTYTLKVTKEKAKEKEETEEKDSSKTIIIILIILVIIGLIYVIFKDDEEDNKESKK